MGAPMEPRSGSIRQADMAKVPPRIRLLVATSIVLLCVACGGRSNSNSRSNGNGVSVSDAKGASSASCIGPYLNDQPPIGPFRGPVPTVNPGATITVYGHWYTSTCNDTGGHDPLKPLPPVHLNLTLPGGDVQQLGEFHPSGKDMGFSISVRVPAATKGWHRDSP